MNLNDFEKQANEIDNKIYELKSKLPNNRKKRKDFIVEIKKLNNFKRDLLNRGYSNLSSWEIVQIARDFKRPKLKDYLEFLDEFVELHGDRKFSDDRGILTGFARVDGEKFMLVGNNKGRNLEENLECNFGCAYPECYRKAKIKMELAEKFNLPIVSFIDTPGAYPGVKSEERGQAIAIAENLKTMAGLKVPIVSVVVGEGGSGGALGIGLCDRLGMLEYSYYSVISPEGCSSILFKDNSKIEKSAESLKLTSKDLYELGLIDEIIKEPLGSAKRDPKKSFENIKNFILKSLGELKDLKAEELVKKRYEKYRNFKFYRVIF